MAKEKLQQQVLGVLRFGRLLGEPSEVILGTGGFSPVV